jgi:hypothetical protein
MAKSTDEFIKENVPRGTSSLKGYGEGKEAADIRRSAREALRGLVGLEPFDLTNPSEAYRIASTPTPLAALGIIGRRGLGIIDAAKASKAFKGKGLDVAEPERFLVKELMDRLKEQGIDVDRTWLRGKKDPELGFQYSPKYEYLEALYEYQKRPDAVERALKGTKTGRPWSQSGTLSRQPGDRKVTKANTKGGVWLTESPTVAESYTGDTGFVIPVLTRKPDVVLDAKGEQWDDFFENSKEFTKAQHDPKVKSIEVRNIIDIGDRGRISYSGLELNDELRALLTSNNLFLKKPFVDEDVVSKLTGEPFPFQDGGEATVDEFISQNMGGEERKQNIKLDSVQDLKDFLQKLPKDLPVKPVEPEEVLPDVALKRKGARELESYINALNPRAQVFDVPEGYQTNYRSTPFSQSGTVGSVPIREPDRINVLKTLTPGQRERVLLHEAEHSMSLRGGDILGEVDSKGRPILTDNAYRAVALLKGNERPVREFVKNVALNKDKIDAFFGEPSFGTEFKKQSYEELRGRGKELALFEEQLASLSALEQATGKFLTQDKEMRKLLFPNTEMMAIFDALTGPRQTRMDARDLPPHTPINPMAYDTGNAVSQFIKEKTREPLLRELPKAKMRVK